MERQIVCFAVPSLDLALVRLAHPEVTTRPCAVAPLQGSRAVLREVSAEAVQEGLSPGLSVEQARRLCPSLQIYPPNPHAVARADQSIGTVIQHYAPVWEPFLSGSVLLDLTGTSRLFGSACDVAARIQEEVLSHLRLEGVAGIGSNKLVAQTASTLVEPSELWDVRHGSERRFMAPLSVRTLPGVHRPCMRTVLKQLDDLNLRSLGEVAEAPLDALETVLGEYAGQLSRWAQGIDPSPVLAPFVQPSVEETMVVSPDEIDDTRLWACMADALERLCRTIRGQRRMCGGLSLTLRYSDQREVMTQARVSPDTCWEIDLSDPLHRLFQRAFRRRIRLRMMTVALTHLTGFAEQGALFDDRPPAEHRTRDRAQRLAVTLDRLHARFGEGMIRYGRPR